MCWLLPQPHPQLYHLPECPAATPTRLSNPTPQHGSEFILFSSCISPPAFLLYFSAFFLLLTSEVTRLCFPLQDVVSTALRLDRLSLSACPSPVTRAPCWTRVRMVSRSACLTVSSPSTPPQWPPSSPRYQ